ncbi:MAG: hypothetical protein P8163_10400 [Candidatus Thiodiazotropha sp.]
MNETYMVLPSAKPEQIRLVKVPHDLDRNEAYRFATGIIAHAEESNDDYGWDEIAEALEVRGFEIVETIIGPALD